ncbi:hypothetical protein BD779DRAFT_1507041 [Infundibulicybe gibba]|nr:hypothetical protein BD779DRAFT_1507041 [Infundibulicybe gibba]
MAENNPFTDPAATTPAPNESPNPQLTALRAMFPDFDDLLLESVLHRRGNQDRAIDTLLGMSDPEYKSEAPPVAAAITPELSQTELDEQLARRLMLEDQEQQQAAWEAHRAQRPPALRSGSRPQFQPQPQSGATPAGERDTMAEVGEQFTRIAETGKKTFGTFFSKVKAKIQELDQTRTTPNTQPTWSSNPNSSAPPPNTYARPPNSAAAYYDPNPPTRSLEQSPQPSFQQPTYTGAPHGYDVTPVAASGPSPTGSGSAGATTPTFPSASSVTPPPAPAPVSTEPAPRISTSASPPINTASLSPPAERQISEDTIGSVDSDSEQDAIKLGAAVADKAGSSEDESDDGLEYAESPFEDPKK